MPAARLTANALVAVMVVDVVHTIVALAMIEHRIGGVTHDGSVLAESLDAIVPLRQLSPALGWLLLVTLLAAGALWIVQIRRTGPPAAPTALWWLSAVVALPVNVIAAARLRSAVGKGAEYLHTTQTGISLLLIGASLALIISAAIGVTVVRRTSADRAPAGLSPATG